ncbi:hypothetical protein BJ508DRAFT_64746 [Ascobolus immersus RN42]|uniref:Uncharacterized protein n=1 Tax=Ascobolus immersus RN42 TaxID=1160509 RepID=A0A3N4INT3_ASCIM|nr:hypothetical protein BJ508DRAFT_64746 [Ascobolus immersus RN42]
MIDSYFFLFFCRLLTFNLVIGYDTQSGVFVFCSLHCHYYFLEFAWRFWRSRLALHSVVHVFFIKHIMVIRIY